MARSPQVKNPSAASRAKEAPKPPPLPDPRQAEGPRRPFADPGWDEAWWWLGIPVAVAAFALISYQISPDWNWRWVSSEGLGFLEIAQFGVMVIGLVIAVQLLFDPFVRRRPLVFAVTALAALSCFYIAGEEVSWGQHIVYFDPTGLLPEDNHSGEFSIHNVHDIFERAPRTVLEIGVFLGGIVVPLWCAVAPKWRASRLALFLPAAALVPAAIGALLFKAIDVSSAGLVSRPSESIEFYLYFFILAYLIVFERRITALETAARGKR